MPMGTIVSQPVLADGRGLRDVPLARALGTPARLGRRPWHGTEVIQLFPKGRAHSLWVVRNAEHSLLGWYVNLEDPHVLRRAHDLDARPRPRHLGAGARPASREWKDEDELEAAVAGGPFHRATRPRRSAPRASASGRERPWPTGWEEWLPPAEWAQPELPDGWNED